MKYPNRVGIQIVTSRHDYLGVLLGSLLRQTFKDWDIYIVFQDQNIVNHHLVQATLKRIENEGHRVKLINASNVNGIGALRNVALNADECEFGCRIDDDSWCEPDFLYKLRQIFDKHEKVGIVGCIVPYIHMDKQYMPPREKYNEITPHYIVKDESIYFYNVPDGQEYPADHLRSSYMYRNEDLKKVKGFPTQFDVNAGFREETLPAVLLSKLGYKHFIVPTAICWHYGAPFGGTRPAWMKVGEEGKWDADEEFLRICNNWEKYLNDN